MGEEQGIAIVEVGGDAFVVDVLHGRVRHEHHDHVGLGVRRRWTHGKTFGFGLGLGARAFAEANANIDPGLLEVQRVGVALGAVAQNRHLPILDKGRVCVGFVIDVCCHVRGLSTEKCFAKIPGRWASVAQRLRLP